MTTETAVFGGGCFWCLDAVFREIRGVRDVESGYAGGRTEGPSYEEVCSGRTGHAEVIRVRFDPAVVSYRDLLEVFFSIHDPTTPDQQGADVGTQYRSIVLYASPAQQAAAEGIVRELTGETVFKAPIVTRVEPLGAYYAAEAYHQDYYARNPAQGYCRAVVAPKLAKFRKNWQARLRPHV